MKSRIETQIDKELADLGVRTYVYHIRAYGEGLSRSLNSAVGKYPLVTLLITADCISTRLLEEANEEN